MHRIIISILIFFSSLTSYGQTNTEQGNQHLSNYTDESGLKQGEWLINDTDSVLLYKVVYLNSISQKTTCFNLKGEQLSVPNDFIKPKLLNGDKLQDPFYNPKIHSEVVKQGCHIVASILVDDCGLVSEVRFLSGCNNEINETVINYLKQRKYNAPIVKNLPVSSFDTYYFITRNESR